MSSSVLGNVEAECLSLLVSELGTPNPMTSEARVLWLAHLVWRPIATPTFPHSCERLHQYVMMRGKFLKTIHTGFTLSGLKARAAMG